MKSSLCIGGLTCLAGAVGLLGAWLYSERGSGKLVWQRPEVKKSVHTFAYKVYADPHLSGGRFFLSKVVFKNEGRKPVRDFSISYPITFHRRRRRFFPRLPRATRS